MTIVYNAANGVEAHMIVHLLEQTGIAGKIDGEHLQGAMGELPAIGNVRVRVQPEDAKQAREIIDDWEAIQPQEPVSPQLETPTQRVSFFIAGALIATGVLYALFRFPGTSEGFDYDGDGVLDEIYYWSGDATSKIELDRNRDKKIDVKWIYGLNGVVESMEADNDFNGTFESRTTYTRGNPMLDQTDTNGDGRADVISKYKHGVLIESELLNPDTYQPKKLKRYSLGKLTEADVDTTGDGKYDTVIRYDQFEQPVEGSAP